MAAIKTLAAMIMNRIAYRLAANADKQHTRLDSAIIELTDALRGNAQKPSDNQHPKTLRGHSSVIDPYIIDHPGPESTWRQVPIAADVQAAARSDQFRLGICGHQDVIHIQIAIGPIPHQAYAVPVAVCNHSL